MCARRFVGEWRGEISSVARPRDDASIVPYKIFAAFVANGLRLSPARWGHRALQTLYRLATHNKTICRERSISGLRAACGGWPPKRACGRSDRSDALIHMPWRIGRKTLQIRWASLERDSPRGGEMSRSDRRDRALFARSGGAGEGWLHRQNLKTCDASHKQILRRTTHFL